MNISQFLTWLASSAGASGALSFIAERIPAFQKFTPSGRSWVMLIGSLVIALAAYAVLTYTPPAILAQLTPFFQIAYGVAGTWIINQLAHSADPNS